MSDVLVLDASVVIKWFVAEEYTPDALRLLKTPVEYVAPDLLIAEVANTMWKKVRRGQLTADRAQRVADALPAIDLLTIPCRELAGEAHELAVATSRSVYDSMYLALALRLDTKLLSADMKFINAIKSIPILAPHISFIADS